VHAASVRSPCAGLVLWYAVTDYYASYRVDSTVPFTRRMRAAADPGSDPPWAEMPVLGTNWYFPKAMLVETTDDNTPDRLRRLPVPVLAYYGSRDTFVDVTQLRRVAAQRSDVELRIAHGAGHGFLLWRPWVIRQTVAWAAQVASSHAAGDSPRSD
jgi:pimeloyl-ACP methyl ester carboxylesterase